MSRDQALQALGIGLEMADHAREQKADLVGTGSRYVVAAGGRGGLGNGHVGFDKVSVGGAYPPFRISFERTRTRIRFVTGRQGNLDEAPGLKHALDGVYGVFSVQNFMEAGYEGEIRQGKAENFRPELYIRPNTAALRERIEALQQKWPGLSIAVRGEEAKVVIPEKYRAGHEAHFAQVTTNFLKYLRDRSGMPAWERPNMLAKYFVSTKGTELSRQGPPRPAPRLAPR